MATATNPQSPGQPIIPVPVSICNSDVLSLANRVGRFCREFHDSTSGNLNNTTSFDRVRFMAFFKSIDDETDHIVASGDIDASQTSRNVMWPVEPLSPMTDITNEDVMNMVRMLMVLWGEILNSNSNRRSFGLDPADAVRIHALVKKCVNFLTVYMENNSPMDYQITADFDPLTPGAPVTG